MRLKAWMRMAATALVAAAIPMSVSAQEEQQHTSSRLPAGLANAIARTVGQARLLDTEQLTQQQELQSSDGVANDNFGYSVALSKDGHTAFIGAPYRNSRKGAAYLFRQHGNTWTEQQELQASDGVAGDSFGQAVVLSGDGRTALISAFNKNSSTGAAYIFTEHNNTWAGQQELVASNGAQRDMFGSSVALSEDGRVALIGALGANFFAGAAYVFTEHDSNWTQQQQLQASNALAFGSSIALNLGGTIALIGAPYNGQGAAYLFTEHDNTWTEQQELEASDGQPGDTFGLSVALSSDGQVALVGAPYKHPALSTGAAYLFTKSGNTWIEQQELKASDGVAGDKFGFSVALNSDGGIALIGAHGKNTFIGGAYLFAQNDSMWTEQQELYRSDYNGAPPGYLFGLSLALNGDGSTALIGSPGANSYKGAADIFREYR